MGPGSFTRTVLGETPVSVEKLTTGKTGALLATYRSGLKAVFKVEKEELENRSATQRGIPVKTHPQREVAFYRLAQMLGFTDIVPETILTALDGVTASAQAFVPAVHLKELDPKLAERPSTEGWAEALIATSLYIPKRFWRQLLLLDLIAGARDRHANNVGVVLRLFDNRPVYRLVAWDNAATFSECFSLYHNVFHKRLFRKHIDLEPYWPKLASLSHDVFQQHLHDLLTPREVYHAYRRLRFILAYPYRIPWTIMSKGNDDSHAFPSYSRWFKAQTTEADGQCTLLLRDSA